MPFSYLYKYNISMRIWHRHLPSAKHRRLCYFRRTFSTTATWTSLLSGESLLEGRTFTGAWQTSQNWGSCHSYTNQQALLFGVNTFAHLYQDLQNFNLNLLQIQAQRDHQVKPRVKGDFWRPFFFPVNAIEEIYQSRLLHFINLIQLRALFTETNSL